MGLSIRVSARAARHIQSAAQWWAINRPAAPGAIADDLEDAFALLAAQPEIGGYYESARVRGVRRLHIRRIRYYLYYRVTEKAIDILALWHTSRGTLPRL